MRTEQAEELIGLGIETEDCDTELVEYWVNTANIDYVCENVAGYANLFISGEVLATVIPIDTFLNILHGRNK